MESKDNIQKSMLLSFVLIFTLGACSQLTPTPQEDVALLPTNTALPPDSSTLPAPPATATPPLLLPTPSYTADPEALHYLQGVEGILRHSARVLPEFTLGLGDVCPDRYLIAFVYVEPDARGGRTLHVDALPQDSDVVHEGEHYIIWSIQREGLWWDRWNRIYMTDRSEPGSYQLQFLLEEPQGTGWQVGTAFGSCPGDDLQLTGLFPVANPLDFNLLYTRFKEEAPFDFWLQDGEQLHHFQWERWEETLIWTLEETPGRLVSVEWSQDSPDIDGDGTPDLVIHWDANGEEAVSTFTAGESGFLPIEAIDTH
ncbi:MAG: hypothetical protein JXA97_14260 [Anaerolineales bacterium]|nr:hypothetical protein [Anaerolineales bacterium]